MHVPGRISLFFLSQLFGWHPVVLEYPLHQHWQYTHLGQMITIHLNTDLSHTENTVRESACLTINVYD